MGLLYPLLNYTKLTMFFAVPKYRSVSQCMILSEANILWVNMADLYSETRRGIKNLHNKELHNLYAARIGVRKFEARKTKWVKHVACLEKSVQKAVVRKSERMRCL
jgi:hypothetical protein